MNTYIAIIALVFLFNGVCAQTVLQVKKYTIENGLKNEHVYCAATDALGFVWFGGPKYLQRFDGIAFKTYEDSLGVDAIVACKTGGIIYLRSDGALVKITHTLSGSVQKVLVVSKSVKNIVSLCLDDRERLWMATAHNEVYFFDLRTSITTAVGTFRGVTKILQSHKGEIMAFGQQGVYWIKSKGTQFIFENFDKSLTEPVFDAAIGDGNSIWVLTKQKLLKYKDHIKHEYKTNVVFNNTKTQLIYSKITVGQKSELYLSSNDGLIVFNTSSKQFYKPEFIDGNGSAIKNVFISCLNYQAAKLLWIGTLSGVLLCDFKAQIFNNIYTVDNLKPLTIRSIIEVGKDTFLCGTFNDGLYYVFDNKKTNKLQKVILNKKMPFSSQVSALGYNTVNTIFKDSRGEVWVGTNSHLIKFSGSTRKQEVLPPLFVWSIVEDPSGVLWFAGREGVITKYNPKSKLLETFTSGSSTYATTKFWHLSRYKNYLLIATSKGVTYFNTTTNRFDNSWPQGEQMKKFISSPCWWIEQRKGMLLFATEGQGLIAIDTITGLAEKFTEVGKNVYGICKVNDQKMWLIIDNALVWYDIENRKTETFNKQKGLIANRYSFHGFCKLRNGDIALGGSLGITTISPKKMQEYTITKNIQLSSFQVMLQEYADISHNNAIIQLPYDKNNVSFNMAELSFSSGFNESYLYKLQGADKHWNSNSFQSAVNYTNLAPGSYTLEVKARYGETARALLSFIIMPPFWQTTWFRLLIIIVIALILTAIMWLRIRAIKNKYLDKRRLLEAELKAAKLQMNPHFIFNSLTSIQNFVLKNNRIEASTYLSKFSLLMRLVLDYSSEQTITVREEIEFISAYLELETLRFENKIKWTIAVDETIDTERSIPALLIQPIVENAIVHGVGPKQYGGTITVLVQDLGGYIKVEVSDTGVGCNQQTKEGFIHKPQGINILQTRLKKINTMYNTSASLITEDLLNVDGTAAGTRVTITIPVL